MLILTHPTSCSFFLLKREKRKHTKKSHTKPPFLKQSNNQNPHKEPVLCWHLLLRMRPALCSVTPLKKTGFPPSSRYQLQNSFLVKRWDCVLTSLSPVCWGVHVCMSWELTEILCIDSSLQSSALLSEDNSANIILLFT